MPRLADPGAGSPAPMLAVLWRVLVPEAERRAIVDGTGKRLVVVPDGPLAFLPFEAWWSKRGKDPKYLLDVGPPVTYAQSATVLISLADRRRRRGAGRPQPVLARATRPIPGPSRHRGRPRRSGADGPVAVQPGRRQAAAAAVLGVEAEWVAKAFQDAGVKAGVFTGASATEAGVRYCRHPAARSSTWPVTG